MDSASEREPDLAAKVAFLADPRHHASGTRKVEVVQTHRSVVFLTETRAYKLKKPVPVDGLALGRLADREAQCRGEVTLNRRLTSGVYDGVVALTLGAAGLQLGGKGRPVEWLVRMRRLPRSCMLDQQIAAGHVDLGSLRRCVAMLAAFYARQPPAGIGPAAFRHALARRIEENRSALDRPDLDLADLHLDPLRRRQLRLLKALREELDQRVREGHVVEGHGDLRPEHVCLERRRPQVIDCLEFSRDLRIVDAIEELGFLALECARLGAPQLEAVIFDTYAATCRDRAPAPVVHFYQSVHAGVRAKLAAWHLDEPGPAGAAHWKDRAREYVRLAHAHADAAACLTPA